MKNLAFYFLLVLFSTTGCKNESCNEESLKAGVDSLNAKKFKEAISFFDSLISKGNQCPLTYYYRAESNLKSGKIDSAKVDYESSLEKGLADCEKKVKANYQIGYLEWLSGKLEKAVERFTAAIKDSGCDSTKYYKLASINRGDVYMDLKKFDKAIEDYSVLITKKEFGFEKSALNNRGICYYNLMDFSKAEADFNGSLALGESTWTPYFYRGMCKIKRGDKESGCEDLKKSEALGYADAAVSIAEFCK